MTSQEIKEEILNGPLAKEIKPYLSMVFNDPEPLRTKLAFRQGMLTPDGAFEILRILNDPTLRPKKIETISSFELIQVLHPLFIKIANLPSSKRDYWMMLMKIYTENNMAINKGTVEEIIAAANGDGILPKQIKDSLLNLFADTTQSRMVELGWSIANEDIQQAMRV